MPHSRVRSQNKETRPTELPLAKCGTTQIYAQNSLHSVQRAVERGRERCQTLKKKVRVRAIRQGVGGDSENEKVKKREGKCAARGKGSGEEGNKAPSACSDPEQHSERASQSASAVGSERARAVDEGCWYRYARRRSSHVIHFRFVSLLSLLQISVSLYPLSDGSTKGVSLQKGSGSVAAKLRFSLGDRSALSRVPRNNR